MKKINIRKKYKTYETLEVITFIAIIISLTALAVFILSFIISVFYQDTEIYIVKYFNFISYCIFGIVYIVKIQLTIIGISLINHVFFVKNKKDHRILLVGVDYYNFLRGKQMHSLNFEKNQLEKFANKIGL